MVKKTAHKIKRCKNALLLLDFFVYLLVERDEALSAALGAHQRAAKSALSRSTTKYTKKPTAQFCNALFCAQFF